MGKWFSSLLLICYELNDVDDIISAGASRLYIEKQSEFESLWNTEYNINDNISSQFTYEHPLALFLF